MKTIYMPLALASALAAALFVSPTVFSSDASDAGAAGEIRTIKVDQGALKVLFDANVPEYSLTYTLPTGCSGTKIDVEEADSKGTLDISHAGSSCRTGATFTLTLGKAFQDRPIALVLKAGVIKLPEGKEQYSKARLAVSYGTVSAGDLNSYCGRKLTNPASVSCAYNAEAKETGKYDITASVKAGIIKL